MKMKQLRRDAGVHSMKFFLCVVGWCFLLVICWPLALLLLVALPVFWLLSLPFRLVFHVVEGTLALLRALLLLPARMLGGGRPSKAT